MTRKGTPRPNNGGARVGAGRKPTTKPLRYVKIDPLDADTADKLAMLTLYFRNETGVTFLSQKDVIKQLVRSEYEQVFSAPQETTTAPHVGGEK